MADHRFQPETLAIHAGQIPDAATGARALPIYQTTSFVFDSADHAASLFNLQTFGNVYSRLSNPTVAVLEERVAALEGGRAALASASGMAAEAMALLTLLQQGDHVVAAGALYGGSVSMLAVNLAKLGIETTFVDGASADAFAAAMRPTTRAVFAESLGNPSLQVLDIAAVAEVAHAHGVPLVVDNTVPSPFLCNPIRFGADIVVHSATKYLGGHGTTLAGVMVESGRFPWDNGKFPGHDRAVEGLSRRQVLRDLRRLRLHDARAHGDAARLRRRARADQRLADPAGHRDAAAAHGAALRQRARGRALPARRTRASAGSTIRACPSIPTTRSSRGRCARSTACRARPGCSPSASRAASPRACASSRRRSCMSHLANIGDTRTLVIHPASTTHRQLDEAQQLAAGVPPDMVRISVGLEHIDDILWDIDQALAAAAASVAR